MSPTLTKIVAVRRSLPAPSYRRNGLVYNAVTVEHIAQETQIPAAEVLASLEALDMVGVVRRWPDGQWASVDANAMR